VRRRTHVTVRRARFDEILALRHAELRPGLPVDTAVFEDDGKATTIHLGAFANEGEAPVGCASLVLRPWQGVPAYQLRGMATRSDLVRRGIGRALLTFIEDLVRDQTPLQLLWCNARASAVEFYQRTGWVIASEEFDIPTVGPHHAMTRRLGMA
jgi:GNAT superfamily N-acetyltransferase